MKANLIVLKVLPAMAALMLGCIAQAGVPDDPNASSSAQALSTNVEQAPTTQQGQARTERAIDPAAARNLPNLNGGAGLTAPGVDPGDPSQDDGDGKEPDPHPWQPHAAAVSAPLH
jgi:hypothetical protein